MVHKIIKIFYETYCVLYVGWDPSKEPTLQLGPDGTYRQLPQQTLRALLTYCAEQSRVPIALYRSLESLSQRTTLFKAGMLGPGPGTKLLARTILDTKAELDKIVTDLVKRLSTLSLSLDITINVLDEEKHGTILRTSLERLESIRSRADGLLYMKEKLQKKVERIARKGAVNLSKYGYKNKQKIVMYGKPGLEILCPVHKQIFGREETGGLSDWSTQPETFPAKEEHVLTTHPSPHSDT